MQKLKKIVGGFFNPNGKGLEFPPAQSLRMAIDENNKDWVEISVVKTRRNQETQR